jgi:predicted transcriptional regulator
MSKAILISINPQHVLNILNKSKTLEIRKSIPKDFKGWVYGYVTKSKPYLYHLEEDNTYLIDYKHEGMWGDTLNGAIPFRFWFDEYYEINKITTSNNYYFPKSRDYNNLPYNMVLDKLCLSNHQIWDYGKGKDLYAWHIKKLEIFDRPMQLSEFYVKKHIEEDLKWYGVITYYEEELKRPPQSYQYVWVKGE